MKISIDQEQCIGCGICVGACPDGIEMVDGRAVVKNNQADCFEAAAEICPINIIVIEK